MEIVEKNNQGQNHKVKRGNSWNTSYTQKNDPHIFPCPDIEMWI